MANALVDKLKQHRADATAHGAERRIALEAAETQNLPAIAPALALLAAADDLVRISPDLVADSLQIIACG